VKNMTNNIEFMDEKIIELIGQKEKELEMQSEKERIEREVLEGLVSLDGEKIEFEERSLLNDRIKIHMPKKFDFMDPEIASIKYPYEKKPEPIFTNETTTKNISFNFVKSDVLEKDIGEFKDSMKLVMERVYPMATWLEDGVREINGRNIGYFEFISQALDADLYNLMFFSVLDGKVLVSNINCIAHEMKSWILVAKGIMSSLKINDSVKK
jgi:hypothetical protein